MDVVVVAGLGLALFLVGPVEGGQVEPQQVHLLVLFSQHLAAFGQGSLQVQSGRLPLLEKKVGLLVITLGEGDRLPELLLLVLELLLLGAQGEECILALLDVAVPADVDLLLEEGLLLEFAGVLLGPAEGLPECLELVLQGFFLELVLVPPGLGFLAGPLVGALQPAQLAGQLLGPLLVLPVFLLRALQLVDLPS